MSILTMAGFKWDPELLWTSLILVGGLLLGALVIFLVDRWRKRAPSVRPSSGDQLAHFRTLYEEGELSLEEFTRIRGLLTRRMMTEMEAEAPAPAAVPNPQPLTSESRNPDVPPPAQAPPPGPPFPNGPFSPG